MKSITQILVMFLVLVMSSSVMAKRNYGNVKFATGGLAGSYYAMGLDIHSFCGEATGGEITVIGETGGSERNLKGIMGKKYGVGILQEDVLRFYEDKADNVYNQNNIKVVANLHQEAVHLLIPHGYKPDNGFFSNTFASKPATMNLSELANQQVTAWGGSVLSAKAISLFVGLNLRVTGTTAAKAATTGLPIFVVAGRDSSSVQAILDTGRYELVGINPNAVGRAQFYKSMDISYQVGENTVEVQTIGVQALLMGKVKSKKKYNKRMTQLASCIEDSYEELSDDDETHTNWQGAYALHEQNGRINWGYFDNDADYLGKEADEEDED